MQRIRGAFRRSIFAGAIAVAVSTAVIPWAEASTGDITEYAVPTTASQPQGVALSPDGSVWFAERSANALGHLVGGTLSETPLPSVGSQPFWLAAGPDGNLWFTEQAADRIGRLTPAGVVTEFAVPTAASQPAGVTLGPDGAMWFAERVGNKIGRIDVRTGAIREYFLPRRDSGPSQITSGADGAVWFTEQTGNRIGRLDPATGAVTEWPMASMNTGLSGIALGSDGNVWFTERNGNNVGRITPSGIVTEYALPSGGADPVSITAGGDGAMWFTELGTNKVGRVDVHTGAITEYSLPTVDSQPYALTSGSRGAVWVTESAGNRLARLTVVTDSTAPTITLSSPADGAVFVGGDVPVASFSCADEPGGSGVATCNGSVADGAPLPMTPGSHVFTVNAADAAGNTASVSHGYVVFAGTDGGLTSQDPPKAGSTITATFALNSYPGGATAGASTKGGANPHALTLLAPGYPMSAAGCGDAVDLAAAQPANATAFMDADGTVHLQWKTDKLWSHSCRTFVLRFGLPGWDSAPATFAVNFR